MGKYSAPSSPLKLLIKVFRHPEKYHFDFIDMMLGLKYRLIHRDGQVSERLYFIKKNTKEAG
jgi:hypothetical protein